MTVRHHGIDNPDRLHVARFVDCTEALGPGRRSAVWMQGCHLRCRGCVAAETHPLDGGREMRVGELVDRLLAISATEGVTFSGGEPFLQASALCELVDQLRSARPAFSVMSYSGYRIEWLRRRGSDAQRALLDRLDLLVDGPYVERLHAPLRWRGSSNQRLLALSDRHPPAELSPDVSAGLEFDVDDALNLDWVGVPPQPGFLDELASATGCHTSARPPAERA